MSLLYSDYIRDWLQNHSPESELWKQSPYQCALAMTTLKIEEDDVWLGVGGNLEVRKILDESVHQIALLMDRDAELSQSRLEDQIFESEDQILSIISSAYDQSIDASFDDSLYSQRYRDVGFVMDLLNDTAYADSPADGTTAAAGSGATASTTATKERDIRDNLISGNNKPVQMPDSVVATKRGTGDAVGKYVSSAAITTNTSTAVATTADNTQESNGKFNPFKSAKTQFIQEGGVLAKNKSDGINNVMKKVASSGGDGAASATDEALPPELAIFEKALIEKIEADIIHKGATVKFDDIAGLSFAKKCVNELICWPMSRPDLFQGLRSLPKGILLFGPPGTGKTLIGKAIASQAGATFFNISASSLTSKWIGEGEKTVRALFAIATLRQPSVVFVDEVDSLLCQRSSDENEASRRIKTEFLVQLDGAGTSEDTRVVIIGATNRPEEIDEAARRRFVKRIYIPLPDEAGRRQLLERLLLGNGCQVNQDLCIDSLVVNTEGFSGADIRSLCTEAAMGPMREAAARYGDRLHSIRAEEVPCISMKHFNDAMEAVAPSVSQADLQRYLSWNSEFGSFRKLS